MITDTLMLYSDVVDNKQEEGGNEKQKAELKRYLELLFNEDREPDPHEVTDDVTSFVKFSSHRSNLHNALAETGVSFERYVARRLQLNSQLFHQGKTVS